VVKRIGKALQGVGPILWGTTNSRGHGSHGTGDKLLPLLAGSLSCLCVFDIHLPVDEGIIGRAHCEVKLSPSGQHIKTRKNLPGGMTTSDGRSAVQDS
jgi:hypothetical protein